VKVIVLIPTYNERDNVGALLAAVRTALPAADVLIIDDGSPDGTGAIVRGLGQADPHILLLERAGKLGLGTAYIAGFRYALARDYQFVIGMDADFSHDPKDLPRLLDAMKDADLAIGSRYVAGGATPDWKLVRKVISGTGNFVARTVLGMPIRDCTTGYKCYRRETLETIDFDSISLVGYGFLIETTYQCYIHKLRIREIPITFVDRRVGKSKMSGRIVREALQFVLRRRWQRITGKIKRIGHANSGSA